MTTHRFLASDNNAGACQQAIDAIAAANQGFAPGYADDHLTQRVEQHFQSIFTPDTHTTLVSTGTAANTLAIAALTRPWMRILCAEQSHLNEDESNTPERFTLCRATPIRPHNHTTNSKLTPDLVHEFGQNTRGVHQPQPGVLTISNITEFGELYTPDEIRALAECARELGFAMHIDGARFANAVDAWMQRANCSAHQAARQLSCDAGVDALSFGGTKNGLLNAEAILLFPQNDQQRFEQAVEALPFLRKSTAHLISKHRFIAAQLDAILADNAWIDLASHANSMAAQLSDKLRHLDINIPFPVDANAIFARLNEDTVAGLHQRGHRFYPFGPKDWQISRLMTSFATTQEHIDIFINDLTESLST
ncbi:MAG: threonine aldolase family protein [Planctomycetota bacterium]|jgi:threonine aldolase